MTLTVKLTPGPALRHVPQFALYGCIWHAAYALIGDPALFDHVKEMDPGRWVAILARYGAVPHHLYRADFGVATPARPEVWRDLRAHVRRLRREHLPLLVTVPSTRVHGYHLVALNLPHPVCDDVVISDSARPGLLTLTWDEFLASPYAQAVQIEQLVSLNVDDHPSVPPPPHPPRAAAGDTMTTPTPKLEGAPA